MGSRTSVREQQISLRTTKKITCTCT